MWNNLYHVEIKKNGLISNRNNFTIIISVFSFPFPLFKINDDEANSLKNR